MSARPSPRAPRHLRGRNRRTITPRRSSRIMTRTGSQPKTSTSACNRLIHVSISRGVVMTQHSASSFWFALRRSTWPALLCVAAASAPAVLIRAHAADAAPAAQTEFGGQCAEALAEGQHVTTNCTTTWTDKDGKVYCFSNDGAKKTFLANPAENLQRARSFMAASNVESIEKAMQDFTNTDAETLVKAV